MNGPLWIRRIVLAGFLVTLIGVWQAPLAQGPPTPDYPAPRFPSYLKPPGSIDDVLPHVRSLVRNTSGFQGSGMGVVNSGESIAIVAAAVAEDMVVDAIKRALEERGVKVTVLHDYELVGVKREEVIALTKARRDFSSEKGYMEAANWIRGFPDSDAARAWLKSRRPDLHDTLFPKNDQLPAALVPVAEKMMNENVGAAIRAYLEKNPGVRGVFWGKGGSTSLRRHMHPLEDKFLGLFTADNRWDAMSALVSYPGDVWQLLEDQSIEPIAFFDRLEITDPEGTDVSTDLNPTQAENWARGVYQRGHLYMLPNQATGRFGYSVVNYPAFQGQWLPREPLALVNGSVAGTTNHTGFYPRWEVVFKDGYIREVKGTGTYVETLREFLQYPKINDAVYPFHDPEHKGYWYLYEIALGSHPKAFRNPSQLAWGRASGERLRSGVFHWGLGITLHHDPDAPLRSQKLIDFTEANNLPPGHGWHTHTYFTTYKGRLRGAGRWVNLTERGRLTAMDHPEVRALASRYGNPDELLTEDWRPEMEGVNTPGRYANYAADPWKHVMAALDQVEAGRYKYFYPPLGQ